VVSAFLTLAPASLLPPARTHRHTLTHTSTPTSTLTSSMYVCARLPTHSHQRGDQDSTGARTRCDSALSSSSRSFPHPIGFHNCSSVIPPRRYFVIHHLIFPAASRRPVCPSACPPVRTGACWRPSGDLVPLSQCTCMRAQGDKTKSTCQAAFLTAPPLPLRNRLYLFLPSAIPCLRVALK
jgi:hypothetical protein